MQMKRIVTVLVALLVVCSMVLTGCSSGTAESADSNEPVEKEEFRVGLLMDGPINDQGWNASAYSGLKAIEADLGAMISYSESVAQSDNEEIFRSYASQGYDLVIGHGFNFVDAAVIVSKDYPETTFICTSCEFNEAPNMGSITDDAFMKGFLGGVVAAALTETNNVAYMGGMEIPPIIEGGKGFIAGATYVNPDIKALAINTGSFSDAGKAKEIAYSLIDEGLDVLMTEADVAGLGAIEAAQNKGILIIGSNTDQNNLAPDTIVTSSIANYDIAYTLVAEAVKKGTWEPSSRVMGLPEGVVYLAPYHGFEEEISDEAKAIIEEVKADIISGALDVREAAAELGQE
jgi:basic membrane protein A